MTISTTPPSWSGEEKVPGEGGCGTGPGLLRGEGALQHRCEATRRAGFLQDQFWQGWCAGGDEVDFFICDDTIFIDTRCWAGTCRAPASTMQTDVSAALENQAAIVHEASLYLEMHRFIVPLLIIKFPGQPAISRGCPRAPGRATTP